MKSLLSGNEAFARGAYEAQVKLVSSYPGTPSTEITEHVSANYDDIYTEWAVNEKVGLEVALGASLGGVRALTCMKHVGLNVASDPLMTSSLTGVNAGLVIIVADDPDMFSSQNEQDSRNYARFARVPMLEPSNSFEAKEFVIKAYEISESHSVPVLVRSTTRISHGKSLVELSDPCSVPPFSVEKDIGKWVMVPGNARRRQSLLGKRDTVLADLSNNMTETHIKGDAIGVICSGITYNYVAEGLPEASILKLNVVWPLPMSEIRKFAKLVDKLYVVEELGAFFETEIRAEGIEVSPLERDYCGELSVLKVRELFGMDKGSGLDVPEVPLRPPNLCPGCSHRGILHAINRLKLYSVGDIGCYTLGFLPPLSAMDTTVCMGASITMAHGLSIAADPQGIAGKSVGVIGDSTFMHTGINGLINTVYNGGMSTIVILDNYVTAMTGHQPNPSTGRRIGGKAAVRIDIEAVVRALGVASVRTVNPLDIEECITALKEETAKDEISVIVAKKPCIFGDRSVIKPPLVILEDKCTGCSACVKIGCPAILFDVEARLASIDESLCNGCGLCPQVCKFDAIITEGSCES